MSGSLPPPKWDASIVGRSLTAVARRVPLAAAILGTLFERPPEIPPDAAGGGVYKPRRD
jgi:hypothetical protein